MPAAPEYAITKPGMSSQQRKSIRTYGRRAASTPEARGEPPAKRRRASPADDEEGTIVVKLPLDDPRLASDSEESVLEEQDEENDSVAPSEQPAEPEKPKSSILNYFRPIKVDISSKETSISSPPPSPPLTDEALSPPAVRIKTRRAPRLLRLRPAARLATEESFENGIDQSEKHGENQNSSRKRSASETRQESPQTNLRGSHKPHPSGLGRTSQTNTKSTQKQHTVQTTLNISSKAGISECKVCNTVWNPFYPDDVKYHKNRHAGILRALNRKDDGVL